MLARRYAAMLTLLIALPAQAEIDFRRDLHAEADLALISTCIEAATSWETARACSGTVGKLCIERIERAISRPDQSGCLWREHDLWQDVYRREALLKEAWTLQKDYEMHGVRDRPLIDAHVTFEKMEENWRTYLQTQCDYEMAHWGAGTIVTTQRPYCEIALIAERIFWMRGLQRMNLKEMQE